jgi:RNA polymerase sigma-54 factor
MALSAKLVMRQGQALVMTPQLLQAIKLLQLSNLELASFIEEELERNPLLERVEDRPDPIQATGEEVIRPEGSEPRETDWANDDLEVDHASLETNLGTELGNVFEQDRTAGPGDGGVPADLHGLSATSWNGTPGGEGEASSVEDYIAATRTLHEMLGDQLAVAGLNTADRLIGHTLIDLIDEAGYLSEALPEVAARLGAPVERLEAVLAMIQSFEPTGVGARSLAECLELQLRELNRFDPAMRAMLEHLDLLAKRDFAALRRICAVDQDDLAEMVAEIRRLDPKPGRSFGGAAMQTVVPDVYVWPSQEGGWNVELNTEVLPRVLVNQTYHAKVSRTSISDIDKTFMTNCLQTANWLTKSLEQRARTILKVSSEIVRQQDAFFARGVEYLRPLNLKTVADAIGMHESTVSRVTSNKYMAGPRGLFELKYFFTASIASTTLGGDAHSAEAVRFRIKQMIDGESPSDVLSDDAIVVRLKAADIVIARRTVAKYRESLRIPSSVERRRDKQVRQGAG